MADRDKARWPWAAILGIGGLLVTDLCVAESGIDHGYVMFELVGIEWQDLTDGRRLGHEETRGYVF